MAKLDVRAAAARAMVEVTAKGQSLSSVIPRWQEKVPERDRALLQELLYGSLRWQLRLEAILKPLLQKPMKAKDADVQALMLIGLYQLLYMRTPDHAAVGATVSATKGLKKPWAKGLCNAVLRNFQRQSDELIEAADEDDASRESHPAWLLSEIKQAYPDHWQAIVSANNQHPPMMLRVNQRHQRRDEYLAKLQALNIDAMPFECGEQGLLLSKPQDVSRLPGFDQGHASVQDGAAQLAAPLLQLAPGQHVLDACAAPGGKTAHALEIAPDLASMTAIDEAEERVERLQQTLSRLSLKAKVITADASTPDQWWDGQLFDRILLDAPCSATGVIRRHPDIKALRRASDIDVLVALQQKILQAMWPLLAPGGVLLYVTCSVLPRENQLQVQRFLTSQEDAQETKLAVDWGLERVVGRQILPGESGMDGFYYACLRKA